MEKWGPAVGLILILAASAFSQADKLSPTDGELIKAATTRPWPGENFPALPALPTYVGSNLIGELQTREIREAYLKLDAKKRNVEWFEGIEILAKKKAVWSLQSCLAHPSEDVQINALRSLEKLNDKRAVPFLLIYAEYMAEWEGGSENATIHGVVHETLAKTLSAITGIKIELKGQDPEGLKKALKLWRKWLLEADFKF